MDSEDMAGQGGLPIKIYIHGHWEFVFTPAQVAKLLSYKEAYVQQLCDQGKLIATKYNGRWWIHNQKFRNTYVDILPF